MALTVAELNAKLTADTRDFSTKLKSAQKDADSFVQRIDSSVSSMMGKWSATAGIAAGAVALAAASAVKAASDLAEAANATGVAFGTATPQVAAWANNLSTAFGATTTEALNAASQFQLVSQEADFTGQQITDLAERAFDLGSVFNQSAQEVSTAIKAGLVGEFEPLRRFGVILNQDKLEAEALARGLIKPTEEMDAGTKQAVIYAEIMRQTAFAQGDAESTAGTAAGQMRQLRVQVDELKTSMGVALLPAFTAVANFITSTMVPSFGKLLEIIGDNINATLYLVQGPLKALGGALDAVGLDSWADSVQGTVGTIDDWRQSVLGMDDAFFDLKDSLVSTNAAGGAFAVSQKPVADSISKVGKSAKDAAKELEKLRDAEISAQDAAYALEDADRSAADAQDALNQLLATGGVDAEKVARANEDLTRANEGLADANERVNDAQEDLNEALADAAAQHLRDVQRATDDLADAQAKLAGETQDVADAEAKLAKLKAQKQARDQAIQNAKAQLAAADTVTERIVAQRALDNALGMEIVTDEELAAATSNVTKEQGEAKTAADGVADATKNLTAVQAQNPAESDRVKTATERLKDAQDAVGVATGKVTDAQNALTEAQKPAPDFAKQVEDAQRAVERANWDVEKATWAAEKAQRAYNEALNAQPKSVSLTRTETVNEIRNITVNARVESLTGLGTGGNVGLGPGQGLIMLPAFHDGGIVPGPRGADVPALLQAGERVIPAGESGGGSAQPMVIQLVADGRVIQEILLGHQRRSGALGFN